MRLGNGWPGFCCGAAAPPRHGPPRAANSRRRKPPARNLAIESLEDRRLLSLSLAAIPSVTVPAGTAVCVALNGTDPGQVVSFSASGSNYSQITPMVMPQTNKSIQINAEVGGVNQAMTFQLFDNLFPNDGHSPNATLSAIQSLFSNHTYDGKTFYRVALDKNNQPFAVQGGVYPAAQPASFKDQFDPNLQFTGPGVLAMANSGPDTNTSEFFITSEAARQLDYSYTIFGFQTTGQAVLQQIAAMPVNTANNDLLNTPVTINSASFITDTQNGVLMLRAAPGTTGQLTVTVTASDGTNAPVQQTFTVNVVADTGLVTADPWASAVPATPTVAFGNGQSSLATTANNSSPQKGITFNVANVSAANLVTVYANGNPIYSAIPAASVFTFTTNGTPTLADGIYNITVTQTLLNSTVTVGTRSEKANVPSLDSQPAVLTVTTTPPQFTSVAPTSATINNQYTYQVQASSIATPLSYSLVASPANMSVSATGLVAWTPGSSQFAPQAVDLRVTDQAGQTSDQTFTINVDSAAPNATGGTSDMNVYGTPLSIPLSAGPYAGIGSYDGSAAANAGSPNLSLGSQVNIIDGTAASSTTLSMAWRTRESALETQNPNTTYATLPTPNTTGYVLPTWAGGLASDVVQMRGVGVQATDYVLQMSIASPYPVSSAALAAAAGQAGFPAVQTVSGGTTTTLPNAGGGAANLGGIVLGSYHPGYSRWEVVNGTAQFVVASGSWVNAVSDNMAVPAAGGYSLVDGKVQWVVTRAAQPPIGQYAVGDYVGSYAQFMSAGQPGNGHALADLRSSWGVDPTTHTVWAILNIPGGGQFAVVADQTA